MPARKHLPFYSWPAADRALFEAAFAPGDLFDENTAPGAGLANGTKQIIRTSYARWLGFLACEAPALLALPPGDRATAAAVRRFVEMLETEVRLTTVAHGIINLGYGMRLMEPAKDWAWLAAVGYRLQSRAKPINRLPQLVPGYQTLALGMELMDAAEAGNASQRQRENQFRDGLIIAVLSIWPIRRRSLAALSTEHVVRTVDGFDIVLGAKDTKERRAESIAVPPELVPCIRRHLHDIRPLIVGRKDHDGFWASRKHGPLSGDRLYTIVRSNVSTAFGKEMGLHDFRRSAATFIAVDDPDKIGLLPWPIIRSV